MSESTETAIEAKAIRDYRKLLTDCIPIDIVVGNSPTPIKAFMRALTYQEELHVRQIILEMREWAEVNKLSEESTRNALTEASLRTRIYYCMRTSFEPIAPRLFADEREVNKVPLAQVINISAKYSESFSITDDDLGESLRARTSGTK